MPTPYSPAAGSVKPRRGAFARKKLVGNLDQDARAIAGFGIAAAGAAMGQVDQDLNAFEDDVVGFMAFDAGDEADPAGIVFMARVVETLGSGERPGIHVDSVMFSPWKL